MRFTLLAFIALGWLCHAQGGKGPKVDLTQLDFKDADFEEPLRLGMMYNISAPPTLRVYVYNTSEVTPLMHLTDKLGSVKFWKGTQWGTEVLLHHNLQRDRDSIITTDRKEDADFFFVPAYPKRFLFRYGNEKGEPRLQELYIQAIQSMPYFQRSGGEDHIFVFPSGRGASCMLAWREWMPNSIFMTPEAHYSDSQLAYAPYYTPGKDILIPGVIKPTMAAMLLEFNKPMMQRTQLSSYFGNPQGKRTRLALAQLHNDNPGDIQMDSVYQQAYALAMTNSKFCLVPRGQSAWTIRSFEAIVAGCVPVFLSDYLRMPFERWIDYSRFTIKWPEKQVDQKFLDYLKNIPDKTLEAARQYMLKIRCAFIYHENPVGCNAFNVILKELDLRRHDFRHSRYSYWQLGGQVMDSNFTTLEQWTPPMGGAKMFMTAVTNLI